MRYFWVLAHSCLIGLGVLAIAFITLARPIHADFNQVVPATHFHHIDGTGLFDYVHSGVDVAISVTLDNSLGGEWIASPVGATDWGAVY